MNKNFWKENTIPFASHEIGSFMSVDYISIPTGSTVRQAMRNLIAQAEYCENLANLYVVENNGQLAGVIELPDLIRARENTPLESLMLGAYPTLCGHENAEEAAARMRLWDSDLPVLDKDARLVGILTSRQLGTLTEDALEEDYAMLGGLPGEEHPDETVLQSAGKRLPWLIALLGLGLLVSGVVGMFETVVSSLAIVVCFQSLVLDMAGNVGTQSLAVTIRMLTDENIDRRQKMQLISHEVQIGLLNGSILGLLAFALVGLYLTFWMGQPLFLAFLISACTGIALLLSMIISTLAGTVIPMLFQQIGVDPAVASGPLITTINDLVAVVSYYGLIWLLLIHILGM